MIKPIMAIDPGVTGAIAGRNNQGEIDVSGMPETMQDLWQFMLGVSLGSYQIGLTVLLENVGFHRPGNSAVASCTFARHCGALEMALVATRIPYTKVTPSKWMKALYGDALPKEKAERKEYIYQQVKLSHPELPKLFKYQADALGMLDYMIREEKRSENEIQK